MSGAPPTKSLLSRKVSTDGGSLGQKKHALSRRKSVGDLSDGKLRHRRTLSLNSSLKLAADRSRENSVAFATEDAAALAGDVRSVQHALEGALLDLASLDVSAKRDNDRGSGPSLPVISVGGAVVCLARDERLIGEMRSQKTAKRLKLAEAFSRDHYKYALFAGGDPIEDEEALHSELTPTEHIQIARASIREGKLGIRSRAGEKEGGANATTFDIAAANFKFEKQKSRRYDSESATILLYSDREPIVIPKLDFSSLPNYRKPRMYNQQVAKGHLKKTKQDKGLIGFLSLKFWH